MRCTICAHPKRAAIEREALGGLPVRAVARNYNVSEDALYRHQRMHLSRPTPGNSTSEGRERDLDRREANDRVVRAVMSKLAGQLNRAEQAGDTLNAVRISRAIVQAAEASHRMDDTGSVPEGDWGGSSVPPRIVIHTSASEALDPDAYRAWYNQLLPPDAYAEWWSERDRAEHAVEIRLPDNGRGDE